MRNGCAASARSSANVAGASTSHQMHKALIGAAAMVARNRSLSAKPTPLAFTTTSAVATPAIAARRPSFVAGYTTTLHQAGGAMSRWLCRSRISGS